MGEVVDIKVNGTIKFNGIDIPNVLGGFGEDKKVILVKHISEIHDEEIKVTNQRINMNKSRFIDGVDIIDLKVVNQIDHNLLLSLGYTKMQISKANNIYALSERGYAKLIKIMDSDLAWQIHDKLVDEYFTMREIIQTSLNDKAQLLLDIYNGGQQGVIASKQLTEIEVREATTPLIAKIEEQQPSVDFCNAIVKSADSIIVREVAKMAYSKDGIEISQNKLYNILRHWNLVCLHSTEPKQYGLDNGWLEVKTSIVNTPYGQRETFTTMVTPKGQIYIIEKLAKMSVEDINAIHKEVQNKRK